MTVYAIGSSVVEGAIAEIVEHRLHTMLMGCTDIILHDRSEHLTVSDVLIFIQEILRSTTERPMVFVLPIIKLQTVDMATVQILQFRCYLRWGLRCVIGAYETITWESLPVTRYVDSNRSIYRLLVAGLTVDINKIALGVV